MAYRGYAECALARDIILCVDDEQTVVRTCCAAITHSGLRTLVAENGAAGLELFIEFKDEIRLVLSDIVMPFVNGIEMAESILRIDPRAKILLMSGYGDEVIEMQGRNRFPLIRKPFIQSVLIDKIWSVMGNSNTTTGASGGAG